MTAYVLDASIAAKWVLPSGQETLAAEALGLLKNFTAGEIGLQVPDLFWPEIANILWKAQHLGRISAQSASESIDWLLELSIPTRETKPLVADAMMIALTWEKTVYDSVYLALAVASGHPLLTADERLANAVGARFPVCWLGSVV